MNKLYRKPITLLVLLCLAVIAGIGTVALTEAGGKPEPWTQSWNCDWELSIKDAQEYMYEMDGETLKKITTVEIFATKTGGTDYFGEYTGKGVITVFNSFSPEEDAYPVIFGGQIAYTNEFPIEFTIEEVILGMPLAWEYTPIEDRDFDGTARLQFNIHLDKIRGIFRDVADWEGLVGSPGIEFQYGYETAILYTDGGYVGLTLHEHWQIPAPFKGTIIGVTGGSSRVTQPPMKNQNATQPPAKNKATQKPPTQKPATQKPATQKPPTQKPATQKPTEKPKATVPPALRSPIPGQEITYKERKIPDLSKFVTPAPTTAGNLTDKLNTSVGMH